MLDIAVVATVFGLIFVGELPDKTAVAGLVLGTRFPWRWAFAGIAAAFATHVVIAVTAGSLLTLLPHHNRDISKQLIQFPDRLLDVADLGFTLDDHLLLPVYHSINDVPTGANPIVELGVCVSALLAA